MFKEKVNAQTDARKMDNRPWHKLAGLWQVELKTSGKQDVFVEHHALSPLLRNIFG